MNDVKSVCVYCASSTKADAAYYRCADELGRLLAEQHIRVVNGAGSMGLMAALSDAALEAGGEVTGVDHLARRAAGFDNDNMHAEVVNGMDIMAVRDAIVRAREIVEKGEGPVLLEFDTYRYYGHSLSDPRNEYRTREEEARWKEVDPVETFRRNLLEAKIMTQFLLRYIMVKK